MPYLSLSLAALGTASYGHTCAGGSKPSVTDKCNIKAMQGRSWSSGHSCTMIRLLHAWGADSSVESMGHASNPGAADTAAQ